MTRLEDPNFLPATTTTTTERRTIKLIPFHHSVVVYRYNQGTCFVLYPFWGWIIYLTPPTAVGAQVWTWRCGSLRRPILGGGGGIGPLPYILCAVCVGRFHFLLFLFVVFSFERAAKLKRPVELLCSVAGCASARSPESKWPSYSAFILHCCFSSYCNWLLDSSIPVKRRFVFLSWIDIPRGMMTINGRHPEEKKMGGKVSSVTLIIAHAAITMI